MREETFKQEISIFVECKKPKLDILFTKNKIIMIEENLYKKYESSRSFASNLDLLSKHLRWHIVLTQYLHFFHENTHDAIQSKTFSALKRCVKRQTCSYDSQLNYFMFSLDNFDKFVRHIFSFFNAIKPIENDKLADIEIVPKLTDADNPIIIFQKHRVNFSDGEQLLQKTMEFLRDILTLSHALVKITKLKLDMLSLPDCFLSNERIGIFLGNEKRELDVILTKNKIIIISNAAYERYQQPSSSKLDVSFLSEFLTQHIILTQCLHFFNANTRDNIRIKTFLLLSRYLKNKQCYSYKRERNFYMFFLDNFDEFMFDMLSLYNKLKPIENKQLANIEVIRELPKSSEPITIFQQSQVNSSGAQLLLLELEKRLADIFKKSHELIGRDIWNLDIDLLQSDVAFQHGSNMMTRMLPKEASDINL